MSSTSISESQNSSTPVSIRTPENDLIDQIAGVASAMANQLYSWAGQEYAKTSQVTDQTVNNFLNVSNQMLNFSNGLTDQYNNLFAPENAQLIKDANSYASPERMAVDMGMAGATQAQANKAAMDNATRALQAYGIDPSSGRYAALDKAAAVQNAANVAGAENMQRVQDIQMGQNLRSQAVQVGAQLPAAITNSANTAIQANTGAINASLANANTGRNLMSLPQSYLNTAMGIKLPPTGQQSSGFSIGRSNSSRPSSQGGQGGAGQPRSSSGNQPSGPAWMPQHGVPGSPGGGGIYSVGPKVMGGGGGGTDWGALTSGYSPDWDQIQNENPDWFGGSGYETGTGYIGDQSNDSFDYGGSNPFSDSGFGQTYDYGGDTYGFGGQNGTDYSDFGSYYDPSANQPTFDTSGWGDYSQPDPSTNWGDGGGAVPYTDYSSGSYDSGGGDTGSYYDSYDDGSGGGGYDSSMDYGSYGDEDSFYAQGGAIPEYTTGGRVPNSASPSGGRRTDDVPANLNAGEFVVPKDVVAYKGQEFFQRLIRAARKQNASRENVRGQQHPGRPNPAATQRPTFTSRPMPRRQMGGR
jgi:hypothetical protein